MKKSKLIAIVIGLIVASAAAVILKPASSEISVVKTDDVLLNLIPKDVLFCVRINDIDSALGNLDKYLTGVSPFPISLQMMAKMQIGQALGDPMLANIGISDSIAAFGISSPGQQIPNYAVMVPVKSFDDFVANNSQAQGPDADGIVSMAAPKPMGNLLAVSAAEGKYALITDESQKNALLSIRDSLGKNTIAQTLNAAEVERATNESIWAYCNVELANGIYGQMLQMQMDEVKAQMPDMKELAAASGNPAMPMDPKAVMNMYFSFFNKMLSESKSVSVAVTLKPTALDATASFTAKPGTELAEFLTTEKMPKEFELAGYLDGTDAVNMIARFDKKMFENMTKMSIAMMREMMPNLMEEKEMDQWLELMEEMAKAGTSQQATSMSIVAEKPHFKMTQMVKMKDTKAVRENMDKSLEFVGKMYKTMQVPATVTYEKDVDKYKNAAIDKIAFDFEMPEGTPGAAQAQQMLDSMYGDNFEYYLAYTDDMTLMTFGAGAQQGVKDIVDATSKSAGPVSGDLKMAFEIMPKAKDADFVCTVNAIKLFGGVSGTLKTLPAPMNMAAAMFDGIEMNSNSCLVTAGKIDNGSASVYVTMPKQHLADIASLAMQVQMKAMQGMPMEIEEMNMDDFEMEEVEHEAHEEMH